MTVFVDQVAWGTPKYLPGVVAELKDKVEPLAEFLRSDGLRIQEKFESIKDYLTDEIDPLPSQQVFDEADPPVTFSDLYVPLRVQPLDISGKRTTESVLGIHAWAQKLLEQSESRKVGFIEGEAGRGKSVFCRMFAAMVRLELFPAFIPVLIRLRDVRVLENNPTKTLETHLEDLDFVQSDSGWLTDENTRFLLIFDGFDELLLQGRESGGLKELVQQLGDFQKNSHHQCLVTGRPLALQGVDRALSQTNNLWRVRLEPMADAQRNEWLSNWAKLFGDAEAQDFQSFLTACPKDIGEQLAREPLLLYLLGRLHRERHLTAQMFSGTEGMRAKVRVYDESIKWVLEQQRQELNEKISGLETEDLRQVLQEAALCVVQSGNETAKLTMLKSRLTDDANPVAELLKQTQSETDKTEDKALNNLLTAFYLNPAEIDRSGSVEFAHKSFSEFLFAERLRAAFKDWAEENKRNRPQLDDTKVAEQIYDLFGYGALDAPVVEYLKEMLFAEGNFDDMVRLFSRLRQFYKNWCSGLYVDKGPTENLPQRKMQQMRAVEISLGLRQIDIYAGLNVIILLFVLHSYGQQNENQSMNKCFQFHPCGDRTLGEDFNRNRMLSIVGYSQIISNFALSNTIGNAIDRYSTGDDGAISSSAFNNTVGRYLTGADLRDTNFNGAELSDSNLSGADLRGSELIGVYLRSANLSYANLQGVTLNGANLRSADLSYIKLMNAQLRGTYFRDADLCSADLRGANFTRADLTHVKMSGSNISGANFTNADLAFADLSNVQHDHHIKWEGVKGLETAKNLPETLKQQLGLT